MPDLRNPIGPALTPSARPASPPVKSDAARAAQRAFFDAALAKAGAPAAPAAPKPVVASQAAAAPVRAAPAKMVRFDPAAPAPERPLRPGSLLDIKV